MAESSTSELAAGTPAAITPTEVPSGGGSRTSSINPSTAIRADGEPVPVGRVCEGETWQFRASGKWANWLFFCGPAGYRFPSLEFLDVRPQVRDQPWFALVGMLDNDPATAFGIGEEAVHTFDRAGDLTVFANPAWWTRWRNSGTVTLAAARLAGPAAPPLSGHRPRQFGERLRKFLEMLDRTRGFLFIFIAVTATGAILAWMEQGLDLVRTVTENAAGGGPQHQLVWLVVWVLLLGFQAWFWARAIVEYQFHGPRRRAGQSNWRDHPFLVWAPRVFGLLPAALLFVAVWNADVQSSWPALIALAVVALSLLTFFWFRKRLTESARSRSDRLRGKGRTRAAGLLSGALSSLKATVIIAGVLLAAVAMIWFTVDPVAPAQQIGPAAVVLMAVALIIPVMVLLIQMGRRWHIRATESLIILAVIFSLWVDNHHVRMSSSPPQAQLAIKGRPDIERAYQTWHDQALPAADGTIPIIFVASQGGASRAGYWTAATLSRLEELTGGQFSRHVFAISSVSGGSLGAVGFLTTLRDRPDLAATTDFRSAVEDFVGRDYLSPALAGAAYADLLQRFLPFPFLPDRAEALERSWEEGWTSHCAGNKCRDDHWLEKDFLSLWSAGKDPGWLPMLLVGGALVEDGRPIITSSLDFGDAIDAWDLHLVVQGDVRLSTAILNGARFPFVSPSGTLVSSSDGSMRQSQALHIVDGGYFDAAGAEVIRQLATAVLAKAAEKNQDVRLRPIFLMITNAGQPSDDDPHPGSQNRPGVIACSGKQLPDDHCPGSSTLSGFATDIIGPFVGLYRSRDAHEERLRNLLQASTPQFVPRRAGQAGGAPAPASEVLTLDLCLGGVPLDWALSQKAKGIMAEALQVCPNKTKLLELTELLQSAANAPPSK
jgi:hypothetical protein